MNITSTFEFAQPGWLWGLLLLVPVALWLFFSTRISRNTRLREYADPELLPHLIRTQKPDNKPLWLRFRRWVWLWLLAVIAMAGPRWDFIDVQLFKPGSSLVVLFDISRSMVVEDVKPHRLARARQELEDLLDQVHGARVGLIAFASTPHVVAPITEDTESIRRLLPALTPGLVRLQGSRLSDALKRAEQVLTGQPVESGKSILLISDGDFVETGLDEQLQDLAAKGIRIHVLGVGTDEGGRIAIGDGRWLLAPDRQPVISRLGEASLHKFADSGEGIYRRANYRGSDTRAILAEVEKVNTPLAQGEGHTRVWHERFYWLVGFSLLLLLPWFWRRTTDRVRDTQ